ncbi:hippocalcin like 1, transcript variant X2 [Ictidomys tridecemlineatus]|nr:hippocalcin like 1, transcript variant X1 [Ictidomys tridecemlineatus]KAG3267582.1 hippocalcin like 1, transcript variant X2 [Ictidomys tridecemlineatus]
MWPAQCFLKNVTVTGAELPDHLGQFWCLDKIRMCGIEGALTLNCHLLSRWVGVCEIRLHHCRRTVNVVLKECQAGRGHAACSVGGLGVPALPQSGPAAWFLGHSRDNGQLLACSAARGGRTWVIASGSRTEGCCLGAGGSLPEGSWRGAVQEAGPLAREGRVHSRRKEQRVLRRLGLVLSSSVQCASSLWSSLTISLTPGQGGQSVPGQGWPPSRSWPRHSFCLWRILCLSVQWMESTWLCARLPSVPCPPVDRPRHGSTGFRGGLSSEFAAWPAVTRTAPGAWTCVSASAPSLCSRPLAHLPM